MLTARADLNEVDAELLRCLLDGASLMAELVDVRVPHDKKQAGLIIGYARTTRWSLPP